MVEDDRALRAMLKRLVESAGYSMKQYCTGTELLGEKNFIEKECNLLDINMPEPDGFAGRSLNERGIRGPVTLITGPGDATLLAFQAGAADFMQKPFDRGELLSVPGAIAQGGHPDG